jgi:hypothetical protein
MALVGLLLLPAAVLAVPAPAAPQPTGPAAAPLIGAPVIVAPPDVTARASLDARSPDLIDDGLGSTLEGIVSGLRSDMSSVLTVISGVPIPSFLDGLPTGDDVLSELDIETADLDAKPTQVLNLPPYGYWNDDGWNVRVHGNVYKQPDIPQDTLDDLANVFLIDTDVEDLSPSGQDQARNLTASIFIVQQKDETVVVDFVNGVATTDAAIGGGADPAAGGQQTIELPDKTTLEGDFDAVVTLRNTSGPGGGYMTSGNATRQVQTLQVYANGTDTGNATAYLVPLEGVTIISDVDDILRVTKIYDPKEGLLNSFARPFAAWMNMPAIYAAWGRASDNLHFHYLTTTPEQVTRSYMDFVYKTYPLGSFDTRPLNFSDVAATLHIRRFLLDKIMRAYPQRKFVLVADTTNSDVMEAYPALYSDYPGQVSCILLRNTSATVYFVSSSLSSSRQNPKTIYILKTLKKNLQKKSSTRALLFPSSA